jgi:hypothetical protein
VKHEVEEVVRVSRAIQPALHDFVTEPVDEFDVAVELTRLAEHEVRLDGQLLPAHASLDQ